MASKLIRRYLEMASEATNANISISSSGDNTVVAATAGKRIVVLSGTISPAATATTVIVKSDSTSLQTLPLAANQEHTFLPGRIATAAGEALVLNLSGANSVQGSVQYVLL